MSSHVYKDCIFTTHALERLKQRSISEYAVADTVSYPDRKFPDGKNTKFIKTISGRKHQVIAHWKPAEQKWLVVSAWVRGENDSEPLYLQLLFAPVRLIWWLLKRFVFVRLLLFILVACFAFFIWYTAAYAHFYAFELSGQQIAKTQLLNVLDESDYPRSFFLQSIAKRTIGVKDTDPEIEKIYKVSHYLDTTFSPLRNIPVTKDAYAFTPEDLFRVVQNGETGMYCTHFARLFAAFAQEVGLTTRLVHITRGLQQHTVAEVYLNDYKQWGTVDVQYDAALIFDAHTGEPLNVVEVINEVENNHPLSIISSFAPSIEKEKNTFPEAYTAYFERDATLQYETAQRNLTFSSLLSTHYLSNVFTLYAKLRALKATFVT